MLLALIGLLPAIPHIIIGVEKLFGKGNGATKKQAATAAISDLVNIAAQAAGTSGAGNSHVMDFISAVIDATVAYFNASGTFPHG